MTKTETAASQVVLTAEDRKDWMTQEQIVRDGLKSFVETGKALTRIHTKSYFEPMSWKVYLKQTFSLTPGRAQRIMQASEMHEKLKEKGFDHLPANEHVAATFYDKWGHEKDEVVFEVWKEILAKREGKPVTAGLVSKVTRDRNGEKPEPKRDKHLVELENLRGTLAALVQRDVDDIPSEILSVLEDIKKKIQKVWRKVKEQNVKVAA